jgi:hypothetical protein
VTDEPTPKGDIWSLLPQPGACPPDVRSDSHSMEVQAERAEARLLDHCSVVGRWLDNEVERASAAGRLSEALDTSTMAMLRRGLGAHSMRRGDLDRLN